jgi:hypothetical protein
MTTDRSSTPITNATDCPRVRHHLWYGRLAGQRRAFAVTSEDTTPRGTCHYVTVWVHCAKHGCRSMREVAYVTPHDRNYESAFALIVEGAEKQVKNNSPAYIARKLGW